MSIAIDLNCIVNGPDHQSNFTTQLLKLIFKADSVNRAKLAKGFPNAVKAIETFQATGKILDLPSD